jgi:hypothetical protein
MQKVFTQTLQGDKESAETKAIYTWQKDEIAWFFDSNYRDVFKVQFTGNHWLSGNKWGYEKVYEYKYLESSGIHEYKINASDEDRGISHEIENLFFTSKEDAVAYGIYYLKRVKNDAISTFRKDLKRITDYEKA